MNSKEEFNNFYRSTESLSFGETPTPELKTIIKLFPTNAAVLDVCCGDGRDTIYLLKSGFRVTAIDFSNQALTKLTKKVKDLGLSTNLIKVIEADIKDWEYPPEEFDLIMSVTGLDHLEITDVESTLDRFTSSLKPGGYIFLQVHTTSDPGYNKDIYKNASELAPLIKTYFQADLLQSLLLKKGYKIISYEERIEDDFDHGEPHKHGFAVALAVKSHSSNI